MILIKIDTIEFEISEEQVIKMKEKTITDNSIYIRNKQDAMELSKKITKELDEEKRKKIIEANKKNDMNYLMSVFENISLFDILKMLINKTRQRI